MPQVISRAVARGSKFHFVIGAMCFIAGAAVVIVIGTSASFIASSPLTASKQRIHLLPKFTAGQVLRYQIETRTTTNGKTTAPIENPEGGSQFRQAVSLIVRLDVLDVQPGTADGIGKVRLRATYEKSAAKSESDAYDPQAAAFEDQYGRLEGRSLEFTIEPGGKLSNLKGIEDVLANPSAGGAARSWMSGLSSGAGFPKKGIIVGEKWGNEQPLADSPLAGLIWRTESTYLRDEACHEEGHQEGHEEGAQGFAFPSSDVAPQAAKAPAKTKAGVNSEVCAVILTRFEIVRNGGRGDETPEDYRRNGLRTSGTWTGKGESLDSISVSTGLLVSSTQTSSQDTNFQIVSASSGSKIRHSAHVESQSQITLLAQAPPQS